VRGHAFFRIRRQASQRDRRLGHRRGGERRVTSAGGVPAADVGRGSSRWHGSPL